MVNKGFWELYQPDEIGVHDVVRFGHFSFNLDSLIITWFSMILIIIFAIFSPNNTGIVYTPSFLSPEISLKSLMGSDRVYPITKRIIIENGK